jgi:predicted nucleotidyltransferase
MGKSGAMDDDFGSQGPKMKLAQVLDQLTRCKPALAEQFGVTGLALFGSTVRGEAGDDSDIDILVSFDSPATSARYFGVLFFLEDRFDRPIDLVTDKALRPMLRPFIAKEAMNI